VVVTLPEIEVVPPVLVARLASGVVPPTIPEKVVAPAGERRRSRERGRAESDRLVRTLH
jgi:hypothetical protein